MRLLILLTLATAVFTTPSFADTPAILGVQNGQLAPCPDKPNCVSSQSREKARFIKPLTFAGAPKEVQMQLTGVVQGMVGARIVTTSDNYMHVEFTSKMMKFVDDVEFMIDPTTHLIHIRSASRVGYYDWGVNRRRMEAIRKSFAASQPAESKSG